MARKKLYGHIRQGLQERNKYKPIFILGVLCGIGLWAFAVFFWASCEIGGFFGYQSGLGTPFELFGFTGYSPITMLGWPSYIYDYEQVGTTIQIAQGVLVLGPIMFGAVVVRLFGQGDVYRDLHGSADFATRKQIEEMGYFGGEGVYVGGWWDQKKRQLFYLRENGPIHILCFAPTRSGKGVGLILPTLLGWEHSSVVLDIKGENYGYTSGWLSSQGHRVLRFDPSDLTRKASRYNPLAEVRFDKHCIADIQQVANMIMDPDGKGVEDYWNKAAIGFFPGVVLYVIIRTLQKEHRRATITEVAFALTDPSREGGPKDLFREMVYGVDTGRVDHRGDPVREGVAEALMKAAPDTDPELAREFERFSASCASEMLAKPDKEMAGVVSSATANLSLYRDPGVAWNIGGSDFTLHDLMNSDYPVNLYLVVSPADIDRLRPLLRIFMAQLLGRLTERMEFDGGKTKQSYKHRMLLMLDEFTSLGKLAIVERAVAYMAGYGVKGYFIVQDTKQLNQCYGHDNALMANCHIRIAYAPNLPETAEYLSKLAGKTTVVQRKISRSFGKSGGSTSVNMQETARDLLTPDECLRLPGIHKVRIGGNEVVEGGDMLIFTAGNAPIYGKQLLHFNDPWFAEKSSMPPVQDIYSNNSDTRQSVRKEQQIDTAPGEDFTHRFERYLNDLPADIAEESV